MNYKGDLPVFLAKRGDLRDELDSILLKRKSKNCDEMIYFNQKPGKKTRQNTYLEGYAVFFISGATLTMMGIH
jgi:hypothetical protein